MDILFFGLVIFLFLLAVFDLSVGVSNDAVNFLSSAVGSRAASFKRIMVVAALGVFVGAAMSNGMMDVARHGIFRPENMSFYDVIAIFMAVMVTDIILLDVFNSLGMPTSTTVSMVFELLGATFVVALFKIAAPESTLQMGDLLNTEKALQVILGIFLSVAIAFVFGTVVQFLSRHARAVYKYLHDDNPADMTVNFVYLNLIQESQELVTSLRKLLRASGKLNLAPAHYRSFTHIDEAGYDAASDDNDE